MIKTIGRVHRKLNPALGIMGILLTKVDRRTNFARDSIPVGADVPGESGQKKPSLEGWQKYMENGEYLRSIESGEEQNYSFIDGNKNNCKKISGRKSV